MNRTNHMRLTLQRAVLKDICLEYQGKTIDNIIQQMDARINEMEKGGTK